MATIHEAISAFDDRTSQIGGSHQMLIGAMHKLLYDEINNGSGNWDMSLSRHARQTVSLYLNDKTPGWIMKSWGDRMNDRKPRHVNDASWVKLINTTLVWLGLEKV